MKNSLRRGLFHPNDIKTVGLGSVSASPMTAPLPAADGDGSQAKRQARRASLSPLVSMPSAPIPGPMSARSYSQPSASLAQAHGRSASSTGSNGSVGRAHEHTFGKYAEDEEENYEDVFGKVMSTCKSGSLVDVGESG
jgi:hypothetical protein